MEVALLLPTVMLMLQLEVVQLDMKVVEDMVVAVEVDIVVAMVCIKDPGVRGPRLDLPAMLEVMQEFLLVT